MRVQWNTEYMVQLLSDMIMIKIKECEDQEEKAQLNVTEDRSTSSNNKIDDFNKRQ